MHQNKHLGPGASVRFLTGIAVGIVVGSLVSNIGFAELPSSSHRRTVAVVDAGQAAGVSLEATLTYV